jgi:hypothetical protein
MKKVKEFQRIFHSFYYIRSLKAADGTIKNCQACCLWHVLSHHPWGAVFAASSHHTQTAVGPVCVRGKTASLAYNVPHI